MNIVVIGAGYVGLVTAALLSELGHNVTCLEAHQGRLQTLQAGEVPIHEPGLKPIVEAGIANGTLDFTDDVQAVTQAQVVYLAVGTPPQEDGSTDLGQIESAAEQIAPYLQPSTVVVIKSTVPVGTGDKVQAIVGTRASVVSNPEFLREGSAIGDARFPDRIVIGAEDGWAGDVVEELLSGLNARVLRTNRRSSELIKYTANAFLATRISFANMIAQFCDHTGAKVDDVMLGAGLDQRVGTHFFVPGLGFGGSCFPKDVASLVYEGRDAGVGMDILESVVRVNDALPDALVQRMEQELGTLTGATVAVLGLAFKGDTDDVRESRSLVLIEALRARGCTLRAFDPEGTENAKKELRGTPVHYASSALEACEGADTVVIATDWKEFAELDLQQVAFRLRGDTLFDGRNLLEADAVNAAGLTYIGIGRPRQSTRALRRVA
jgi:UDPglucose 6-dehydrogenase